MHFPELAAFAEECAAVDLTLAAVGADAWRGPGLGSWTMTQLVAHMVRGASRIDQYLDQPVDGPVAADRITYWHGVADEAAAVAQRAVTEAEGVDPATLPARFATAWHRSVDRAQQLPADHVVATLRGPMRLDEYTATRVVEMAVHHTDVARALSVPPVMTPAAAQMTASVLEGLLGEAKPRNLGRARFIAVATGRTPSDDPRFPVLA